LERSKKDEEKLPKTVLDDDEAQAEGKLLNEAVDRGISFNADMMFDNMVSQFKNVKELYGETLVRELTGYDSRYIERNSRIPEFQRRIRDKIERKIQDLKSKDLITKNGRPTNEGVRLASVTLCIQELDKITPKDILGEKVQEQESHYGQKDATDEGSTPRPRYRDLALKRTVKTSLRRGHTKIEENDLRAVKRKSKGSLYVIYGLDVSGSMKGPKLNVAKKSGIALAYKAINQHDKVGLIAFNSEIVKSVPPTHEFQHLVDQIIPLQSSKETNMVHAIEQAIDMFPDNAATKHLILLTDAVPTVGATDQTIEAVMRAKASNITISVVGIKLTEGLEIAQTIVDTSGGRLYVVRDLGDMDSVILEDYYGL
ncbi:MAG: vWA domain-containing protein, partial [Nanoarchaeota archaeon]